MESNIDIDKALSDLEMQKQELRNQRENTEARKIIEQCKEWWRSPDGRKAIKNSYLSEDYGESE